MYVCTTGGSGRRQLGGAERILVDLIPALADRGVEVVAYTPDDEVGRLLRAAGVPWTDLSARSRLDLSYVRAIRREVRRVKPDIVCSHLLSAAMHCRAALGVDLRGIPLVVTLHNSLWQYRDTVDGFRARASVQSNIALDLLMRRLRSHTTVAVSQFEADDLVTKGKVGNLRVIPNPLPADWPVAAPREPGSALRVGYMGRLEPEKGADLIEPTAALMPDATFLVAGEGSVPVRPGPNVEVLGRVVAADFLRSIDCLIVPSRVESFGLSALEALSLGVPVVHTGAGGLAEVTRHAAGTMAVQAALEPAAFASAIREATASSTPAQRLGIAGRYAEEYAFDRFVDRWESMYRTILDEAP
ncbi:glycosyl transferase [Longispora fulva]|nr:glycosyl transferase [Longispora fulva]